MDEVVECLKGVEVAHLGDDCVLGVFVCAGSAELLPAFLVGIINFSLPFCYSPYLLGLSVRYRTSSLVGMFLFNR